MSDSLSVGSSSTVFVVSFVTSLLVEVLVVVSVFVVFEEDVVVPEELESSVSTYALEIYPVTPSYSA